MSTNDQLILYYAVPPIFRLDKYKMNGLNGWNLGGLGPKWTTLESSLTLVLFDSRPPDFSCLRRRLVTPSVNRSLLYPSTFISVHFYDRPLWTRFFWPIRTLELYLILFKREQRNHRYQKCRSRCSIRVLLKVFGFWIWFLNALWLIIYESSSMTSTWNKFFT